MANNEFDDKIYTPRPSENVFSPSLTSDFKNPVSSVVVSPPTTVQARFFDVILVSICTSFKVSTFKGVSQSYLFLWELFKDIQKRETAETFQDYRVDLLGHFLFFRFLELSLVPKL